MTLDKLRYSLTKHKEKIVFDFYNYQLLVHPSIEYNDLLKRLEDDVDLLPTIKMTDDKTEIKFYSHGYNENIYSKSELLTFILAYISKDWDIIKGIRKTTHQPHFWLKSDNVIYDPAMAIITNEVEYSKHFKQQIEIKNDNVSSYLKENNNLYKFYKKGLLNKLKSKNFSIYFVEKILEKVNENIEKQYALNKETINEVKENFSLDEFIRLRQLLTKQRTSCLKSYDIAYHPSVKSNIISLIEEQIEKVEKILYNSRYINFFKYRGFNYHVNTIGNCYPLSICLNLYDARFKLIQGGISYIESDYYKKTAIYQHSWLEIDDYVYDPALKIVTPKELYYIFVEKHNEYNKEETESILKRIVFNLTHFEDYLNGKQVGGDQSIQTRLSIKYINSEEYKKEGEEFIAIFKSKNTIKR